ncbi:tetracycline resistance protein, class C [Halyomorpha halys]|uniref:tetracycline resistance protein, class C n=1 Tax=Halyomorpha halys TaxID=286706 RepID=UPI0034D15ED2
MGLLSVLKGLVVLLPVLISTMAAMMLVGVSYNFIAQKSCSPEGVPEDINGFICGDGAILDEVNDITTTTASIRSACSAVASSSFGFLRDVTGKSRPLMFVGVIGELITVSTFFMAAVYWSSSAWIPPLVQTFVSGAFGETIMQLGATCLLIQESTPEELPSRLQVYMTANLFLMLVGGTISTMILTTFGYRWLFTVAIGLQVIALLLVIILVKEKENVTKNVQDSLANLKKVFRWRENVIVLWLMLFAGPITLSILTSEGANNSSFYQIQFRFSMYETSAYTSYSFVIAIVGSMVVPVILRKVFHCKDLTIGIIASIMNCLGPVALAFVETRLWLYLISILNFMRLVSLPLPNTVISRIVNHDEIGTYLGIAAVVTLWVPYSITKIYRAVFAATEYTWIGAYFFVSTGFFVLLVVIYSISYFLFDESKQTGEITESKENLDQNIENGKSNLPDRTGIRS